MQNKQKKTQYSWRKRQRKVAKKYSISFSTPIFLSTYGTTMVGKGLVLALHYIATKEITYSHGNAEYIMRNIKMLQDKKTQGKGEKENNLL